MDQQAQQQQHAGEYQFNPEQQMLHEILQLLEDSQSPSQAVQAEVQKKLEHFNQIPEFNSYLVYIFTQVWMSCGIFKIMILYLYCALCMPTIQEICALLACVFIEPSHGRCKATMAIARTTRARWPVSF